MSLVDLRYNVLSLFAPIFPEIEFKNDLKEEFPDNAKSVGSLFRFLYNELQ